MAAPSSNSRAETVELLLGLQSMRREVRASDPGLLINMSGYMRLSHAEHLVSSASTVLASHPLNDIEAVLDTLKLIIYDLLATVRAWSLMHCNELSTNCFFFAEAIESDMQGRVYASLLAGISGCNPESPGLGFCGFPNPQPGAG